MPAYIKNIDHETVLSLASQVAVVPGQIVSRTLAQNSAVSITVFAFSKGKEIGMHDSSGDAMATVLKGTGRFTAGGATYTVQTGQTLVMPVRIPHSVYAAEDMKMVLTVIFPHT